MRRALSALVLLTGCLGAQPDLTKRLDGIASAWSAERGFMGAVLVAKGGTVLLQKGYGMANLEWDIPNTPDTKFRLGSITKQFTATAILQLAEQGKLSLDDSVLKYAPEGPEIWKPITIHHLLNHTSGIESYTDMPSFAKPVTRRTPLTPLEIVMLSKDRQLLFQPGEQFKYNNTGYVFLGYIVEKVSGMKYDEYVRSRILAPLGMNDSGYDWTRTVLKRRAAGYGYTPGSKSHANADYLDMSLPHAAGSLYSTARDLYKWDRALAAGRLLRKESRDRMFTFGRGSYGYGWVEERAYGKQWVGHGGGINGFSTMIMRAKEDDAVLIVLSNVENADAGALARFLRSALYEENVVLPWQRTSTAVDPK